jgi:integrase
LQGSVDLDRGRIEVVDNYVPVDGAKKPKTGSVGTVPISEDLCPVLQELKNIAHRLGLDGPDNYVLMGTGPLFKHARRAGRINLSGPKTPKEV